MIIVLESNHLKDKFINKNFISNINVKDKITFKKDNIYYFGNYTKEGLDIVKKKLLRNKKTIIKAIENNIKIIVCGNSIELFNNNFNNNNLNLYTNYNPRSFKKRFNKLKIKNKTNNLSIKNVYSLDKVIEASNFKYKNFLCISDEVYIDKIIKRKKTK